MPLSAAIFLILNGFLLYGAEILRRKKPELQNTHDDEQIAKMSWSQGVLVGFSECLALLPGFSRTGATIGGGLLAGLNHKDAARFSFLLATPIIFGAAILKLPELAISSNANFVLPILVGFMASGVTAYFSIRFLTKYFETRKLTPFALYCVVVGVTTSIFFLLR